LVSGKVRWRGRPTASDELLGPGSSRDARRGRASVRSIWVPLVAPLPSAVLMKAHRAPIICQAYHQAPLFSAGETGEPGVPRRTGFFPPSQPFVIGPALPPRLSRTLRAARRTPAGCGVTKHVLVAHVPEPQDTDGVTKLARFGSRFGDHVVANPEADVPELPDSPFTGRPERQFSAV
jgi:hypothetical protein